MEEPLDGALMLYRHGAEGRQETLLELLNASNEVIPFIKADGNVLLLTRTNIGWVFISSGVAFTLLARPEAPPTRRQRVQLRFTDARRIDGAIQWNALEEHRRLSDFLNECGQFFLMVTGIGFLVVNRAQVLETHILGSTEVVSTADVQAAERLQARPR
jgi:hypothetical protein